MTMRYMNAGAFYTTIYRFKEIIFAPTFLNTFGSLLTSIIIVTTVGYTEDQLNNSSLPDIYDYRASNLNDLRAGFKNPPLKAGPWVYWFWFDSVVSKEEITRELEEMAEAGIGGVEVRDVTMHGFSGEPGPMYAPEDWEILGHRKYLHLSPEYIDILEHTLSEAERLGLYFSMNLGQGWPPGGRWITEEHRSKHLLSSGHRLAGPLKLEGSAAVSVSENTLVSAWRLSDDHEVIPDTYLDLSDSVNTDGQLDWEVPEGEWLLGLFQTVSGGMVDKGGGPEVDPASKEAVLFHLNFIFDRLTPKLGRFYGSTFVDVATDSWEYVRSKTGRYWSPSLVKHSEEILGYALEQRMYSLLEYGPDKEAFEADLLHLEETLIRKNFFETVTEFLNERRIRHRPQIYGRGLERDLLESYAMVNSPEIEEGRYVVEAVWAGRLMAKPVISVEAFTFISVQDGNLLRDYRGQYGRGSSVNKNDMWKATPEKIIHLSNSHFARGLRGCLKSAEACRRD